MAKNIKLTFLIPAYNEEEIIKDTLDRSVKFLSKKKYSWEILVVDDGSKDNTSKIVKNYKNNAIHLHILKTNQGKGGALIKGMELARGDYIIFSDADLSVPIKFIDNFMSELEEGADVVIGTRRTSKSKVEVHQPWHREQMGRVYTALSRLITATQTTDFTCGFKGFTKEAGKKIFKNMTLKRWAYDSEVLFLAHKYGYKIEEIPVVWRNREATRVALGSAVFTSFWDLIKIRLNDLQGKYEAR